MHGMAQLHCCEHQHATVRSSNMSASLACHLCLDAACQQTEAGAARLGRGLCERGPPCGRRTIQRDCTPPAARGEAAEEKHTQIRSARQYKARETNVMSLVSRHLRLIICDASQMRHVA